MSFFLLRIKVRDLLCLSIKKAGLNCNDYIQMLYISMINKMYFCVLANCRNDFNILIDMAGLVLIKITAGYLFQVKFLQPVFSISGAIEISGVGFCPHFWSRLSTLKADW